VIVLSKLIAGRFERPSHDRTHFGRQSAADDDHPIVVDPGGQVPPLVPLPLFG
jgi:hypothetical protein